MLIQYLCACIIPFIRIHFAATMSRCQTTVTRSASSSSSSSKACSGQFFSIIDIFDTKRFFLCSRMRLPTTNGSSIPCCAQYSGSRSRYIRACCSLLIRFHSLRFSLRRVWSTRLLCVVTIAGGRLRSATPLGLQRQTLNRCAFVCRGNRLLQFAHVCDVKYSSTILTTELSSFFMLFTNFRVPGHRLLFLIPVQKQKK